MPCEAKFQKATGKKGLNRVAEKEEGRKTLLAQPGV